MEHVMGSVEQHMQYNKNAILDTQSELERIKIATNDRLDRKDWELESVRRDLKDAEKELEANKNKLFTKERELENIKIDLQDTKERLKESQEIQSQLKTAIDEVRKNAEENHKTLQGKLEGTEQSLHHQLKVNAQLQLQVVPVVIELAEFEKYRYNEIFNSTGFYTSDRGYKMRLGIYPCGIITAHVLVGIYLMKGNYDDHLTWPVMGTLTVQLLNQLSDSNHSEPVPFHFDGSSAPYCHRVMIGTESSRGLWCHQFIPHKKLSYDVAKKFQYLKDDYVFFRVCDFQ